MAFRTADQAAPARWWKAVTPSDTVNLPAGCRAIWVNVTGDVNLVGEDDVGVIFLAVPAGTLLPFAAKRVNNTGTAATVIALY